MRQLRAISQFQRDVVSHPHGLQMKTIYQGSSVSQTPVKPLRGNWVPESKDLLTLATMRSFNYKKVGTPEQKASDSFVYIQCLLLAST